MSPLIPALAGALIVAGLIGIVVGLVPAQVPSAAPPRRRLWLVSRWRAVPNRTRWLAAGGLVGGAVAYALTGLLATLIAVPAAAVGLPWLLDASPARARLERLEAMAEWTRSLSGVLTVGVGLEQALVATLRSTPRALKPEVGRLAARLQARWATEDALRAFADDLDDATGDLIASALILGSRRRGAGLASVLDGLAESVAAEVAARREIEADQAKPRAVGRNVTMVTLVVLVALAATGDNLDPYRTPAGQIILSALLVAYGASLVWLRRMSTPRPMPRFLGTHSSKATA